MYKSILGFELYTLKGSILFKNEANFEINSRAIDRKIAEIFG